MRHPLPPARPRDPPDSSCLQDELSQRILPMDALAPLMLGKILCFQQQSEKEGSLPSCKAFLLSSAA
eukprot:m.90158 g.90158  ORF g.90158 m.90158 type:complete len:67 (+) comp51085_c0_seq10:74-274(+)